MENIKKVYPKSYRQFPILRTGSIFHNACSTIVSIATQQDNTTKNTTKKNIHLLYHATTQPNTIVTYGASDTILAVNSDASYISETNTRNRAGGHFFMSSDSPKLPNNRAILALVQIIKTVMSSEEEDEMGSL